MKKLLIIESDTNDADYVHSLNYVNDVDIAFINSIIPKLIKKDFGGYLWENGNQGDAYIEYKGILTEYEIDRFGNFIPYGEYGVHTIESIKLLDVAKEQNLTE